MHRLRERWVALLGGALLVTLSVSTAFGADPEDELDGPRGQTIASFVHSLIFTEDEPADEKNLDEEENLDDEDVLDQEELDEEAEEELVEGERADGAAHGACVSAIAQDEGAVGGPNENHGGAVSEAARETCWEPEDEAAADELSDTEEELTEEELTAKEERKAEQAAAKAEREAARAEAKAARDAAHAAARTERNAAKAERKAARGNGG